MEAEIHASVLEINRISPQVISVRLGSFSKELVGFRPGQHVFVYINIGGEEFNRAYSIHHYKPGEYLEFAVREVKGGKVSPILNRQLNVGDQVMISQPTGHFVVNPKANLKRVHVFLSAGVGITPFISMIPALLEDEPMSKVILAYGCRTEQDILFRHLLEHWEKHYQDQFFCHVSLSQHSKPKGLFSMFKKGNQSTWTGLEGRLEYAHLDRILENTRLDSVETFYYICGPGGFIEKMKSYATDHGVKPDQILTEYFYVKSESIQASPLYTGKYRLEVNLHGRHIDLEADRSVYILDAMLTAGLHPPYSCQSGVCSSCMAVLKQGKVHMDHDHALSKTEIEAGWVLSCQSRPVSDHVQLEFK